MTTITAADLLRVALTVRADLAVVVLVGSL